MISDDLPPTPLKPRTGWTRWWVLAVLVFALAVWGAWTITARPMRAPAEAHTRTMSRSAISLPGDSP